MQDRACNYQVRSGNRFQNGQLETPTVILPGEAGVPLYSIIRCARSLNKSRATPQLLEWPGTTQTAIGMFENRISKNKTLPKELPSSSLVSSSLPRKLDSHEPD